MTTITQGRTEPAITRQGAALAPGVPIAAVAVMTARAFAAPGLGTLIRFSVGVSRMVQPGLAAGLAGSLGGWGLLAMLEGRTWHDHDRALRATVAVVVTTAAAALALTHLAVTAVMVPALCRSAAWQAQRPASADHQRLAPGVFRPCDPSP
jgi:hypothetical protein